MSNVSEGPDRAETRQIQPDPRGDRPAQSAQIQGETAGSWNDGWNDPAKVTAPNPPPQDLGSLARKLATRIMGTDIDGEPDIRTWSPGARVRRLAVTIEGLGRAVVREARQELVIDLMDKIGPLVRELVREAMQREEAQAEAHPPEVSPAAPFGWWAMHPRRRAAFLDWLARQEPQVESEAPFTAVRDAACDLLSGVHWVRNERGEAVRYELTRERAAEPVEAPDQELARLRAQVAELQENARKQHAIDGERLRDLQEILDGTEAWRWLSEGQRGVVFERLESHASYHHRYGHVYDGNAYKTAIAALRALAPDPERARLREELEEARNQQDFPGG